MDGFKSFITIVLSFAAVLFWIMEWMASEENDPEARSSINYGMGIVAVIAALLISGAIVMELHTWQAWGFVALLMCIVAGGCYFGIQVEEHAIKNARSCGKCGTRFYNPDRSIPLKFCSKCGAELGAGKLAHCDERLD